VLHCIIDNIQMTEGRMLVSFDLDHGSPTPASWKRRSLKEDDEISFLQQTNNTIS